jgi:anti-sigma regulatory factor (Ser/Thr protein kinase)
MVFYKSENLPAAAQQPLRLASGEPLAERLAGRSDNSFARWFDVLYRAMRHEVNNSIGIFQWISFYHPEKQRDISLLSRSYMRLGVLSRLCICPEPRSDMMKKGDLFTQVQIKKVFPGSSLDFDAVKKMTIHEIQSFRAALRRLHNYYYSVLQPSHDLFQPNPGPFESAEILSAKGPAIERVCRLGNLVADTLERLLASNPDSYLDFVSGSPFNIKSPLFFFHWRIVSVANDYGYGLTPPQGGASVPVIHNPALVRLILENVFANAKRASEEAGVEPTMELSMSAVPDAILFRFKDNGCGMSPDIIQKLNSGESVTTKTGEGDHGLGFAYCRELAEKMGGSLYVESSEPGKGATVVLELKTSHPSSAPLPS